MQFTFASTFLAFLFLFRLCLATPLAQPEKRDILGWMFACATKDWSAKCGRLPFTGWGQCSNDVGTDFDGNSLENRIAAAAPETDRVLCQVWAYPNCPEGGSQPPVTLNYPPNGNFIPKYSLPDQMGNQVKSWKCSDVNKTVA